MSGLLLTQDYAAKEVVKDAWGTWLSETWTWDWWVTLTFDQRSTVKGGKFAQGSATHDLVGWRRSSASWDAWLSEIEARPEPGGLRSSYWFRGREPNPNHRGTHFHALVGGVAHLSRRDAWARWFASNGVARIEPYDPSRGAGWYVAKYVVKELGDLSFSPNAGAHMKEQLSDRYTESASERVNGEQGYFDGWPRGSIRAGSLSGRGREPTVDS